MNHLNENEQAMRARCDAATKGPWYLVTNIDGCDAIRPWVGCPDNGDGNDVLFSYEDDVWSEDGRTRFVNNALFTIAARQDLPACLDTIEKLRGELAKAEALLKTIMARLDRYEAVNGEDYAALRAFLESKG